MSKIEEQIQHLGETVASLHDFSASQDRLVLDLKPLEGGARRYLILSECKELALPVMWNMVNPRIVRSNGTAMEFVDEGVHVLCEDASIHHHFQRQGTAVARSRTLLTEEERKAKREKIADKIRRNVARSRAEIVEDRRARMAKIERDIHDWGEGRLWDYCTTHSMTVIRLTLAGNDRDEYLVLSMCQNLALPVRWNISDPKMSAVSDDLYEFVDNGVRVRCEDVAIHPRYVREA